MFTWIAENFGTIIVAISLSVAVASVILGITRDKRNGKRSVCGCGGGGCCRSASMRPTGINNNIQIES